MMVQARSLRGAKAKDKLPIATFHFWFSREPQSSIRPSPPPPPPLEVQVLMSGSHRFGGLCEFLQNGLKKGNFNATEAAAASGPVVKIEGNGVGAVAVDSSDCCWLEEARLAGCCCMLTLHGGAENEGRWLMGESESGEDEKGNGRGGGKVWLVSAGKNKRTRLGEGAAVASPKDSCRAPSFFFCQCLFS
ncbi:hypothetical protein NC652_018230 [Populus alba x Populus x berolinensis]|nr:hypothetical protein NC652_018230 [Populus alba x Populus x berolinensis]